MSEHIHKSHNVSKLMYHFVFPTKYRRVVVSEEVDEVIKETWQHFGNGCCRQNMKCRKINGYSLIF